MELAFSLIVACLVALAFAPAVKRYPWAFYFLALLSNVVYLYAWFVGAPQWLWQNVLEYLQRCLLGISFFVVVMYTGALDRRSPLRMRLQPIRAELSILATILCVGHVVAYASSYVPNIGPMVRGQSAFVLLALFVAALLSILLAILAATSVKVVKRLMRMESWRRLHKLSYLFYGLAFLHITAFLLPGIMAGNLTLLPDYAIYVTVFVGYGILRIKGGRSGTLNSLDGGCACWPEK